jgi:HEAT repeat protein
LIDLKGEDRHIVNGRDNDLWRQGKYGGGIDCSTSFWNSNTSPWSDDELIPRKETPPPPITPPFFEKKEVLPELEALQDDEDSAQMVITRLSEKGPSIIPQLIDYLDIKDDQLKLTIMEIVKKIGKDAGPVLRKALEDNNLDNALKYYILYMLGDIEDEHSQNSFISFLKGDDPKLRALAMKGLSKLEPALPLVEILPYAEDEKPAVRKYLAIALKGYEESAALKVLTKLLADNHFNVRFAAFETLRGKGIKAKQHLLELIDHRDRYPSYAVNLARDLLEECGIRNW